MATPPQASPSLHVLIVGGSVAGLTLANALSRANVNFTLLESKADPWADNASGAALTLLPNGCRILDQLGLFEDICKVAEPLHSHRTWLEDGSLLREIDLNRIKSRRSGYPLLVISRRELLRTLYNGIPEKRSIQFDCKVVRVTSNPSGVILHCADASVIRGSAVVGSDGIHSFTRREMMRHIRDCKPGRLSPEIQTRASWPYSGLFGTSAPIQGLEKGVAHRTYGNGWSFIVTVGHDCRVYWYIAITSNLLEQASLGVPYPGQAKVDTTAIAGLFLEKKVNATITFGQLFRDRINVAYVQLQECVQSEWAWGRFACIGDAVHKMTPNIAQGANCAMETAASLSNFIISNAPRSQEKAALSLDSWGNSRRYVMNVYLWASHTLIRAEAAPNWPYRLLGLYLGYLHGDFIIGCISDITRFTEKLDFLPLPQRRVKYKEVDGSDPLFKLKALGVLLVWVVVYLLYNVTLSSSRWERSGLGL